MYKKEISCFLVEIKAPRCLIGFVNGSIGISKLIMLSNSEYVALGSYLVDCFLYFLSVKSEEKSSPKMSMVNSVGTGFEK